MERDHHNLSAGFSLMEALVALAVAGIVSVVGIPALTTVYLDNQRAAVVNDLLATLQIARSEAIKRNRRVVVCASADGASCGGAWTDGAIVFPDDDNDGQRDDVEPVVSAAAVGQGLSVSSSQFPAFLIYRPSGRVMADDVTDNEGALEICDHRGATHARTVVIDSSGRPRVATVDARGEPPSC